MTVGRFIEIAREAVGLTAEHERFRALCGPGESPAMQAALSRKSTCALFVRGSLAYALLRGDVETIESGSSRDWYRAMRVPRRLWAPYVDQHAMTDLVEVCDVVGLVAPTLAKLSAIRPGALVVVGEGNDLHVYVVAAIDQAHWPDAGSPIVLTGIEAGQVDDAGLQCVRAKVHHISAAGVDTTARVYGAPASKDVVLLPDDAPAYVRPIAYVLDPFKLLGEVG